MKIAIGSTNPVKVRAVEAVLQRVYSTPEVIAVAVDSGVPDQPYGDEQTRAGAVNRARGALAKAVADLGVGLEGGLIDTEHGLMTCAWCAIVDSAGALGIGGSVNVLLPPAVVERLQQGAELGDAMDQVTGMRDTKQQMGAVGVLSGGLTNRQEAYEHLIKMALARFLRPAYFHEEQRITRMDGLFGKESVNPSDLCSHQEPPLEEQDETLSRTTRQPNRPG
ncbi:MAG: inosine/xanthosine triphosphatase [Anaerolineae bacterium]